MAKMAGRGKKNNVFLAVLLILETVACIFVVSSRLSHIRYEFQYEVSPLEGKSMTLKNRTDLAEDYQLYENEGLYELILTYENIGTYPAGMQRELEIVAEKSKKNCYRLYPQADGSSSLYWMTEAQKIPAGKTGSFSVMISIPNGESTIKISEKQDKLSGNFLSMTVEVPKNPGEWTESSCPGRTE